MKQVESPLTGGLIGTVLIAIGVSMWLLADKAVRGGADPNNLLIWTVNGVSLLLIVAGIGFIVISIIWAIWVTTDRRGR